MKVISLVLLISLTGWNYSQGQNPPQVIPPTPNVASIAKYGNTPVGLYTGQPNVSFPIHTIQYSDFSYPITLAYNYNGLRPEEYPGWVGMGWTLQATGVITRQTRGIADERLYGYNGYHKKGLDVVSFISNGMNTTSPTYQSLLQGFKDGYIDGEPDLFVLSAPGLSGKFFFDDTQCNSQVMEGNLVIKEAIMIPFSKVKVKGFFDYYARYNTATGIIKKFEITSEQGVKYVFDVIEKAAGIIEDIDNGNASADFGNAWYLSSIITPFNNSIQFQYHYRVLDNPATVSEELVLPDNFNGTPQYHTTSTTEAILDRIIFRNGSIDFIEEINPRADWNSMTWTYSGRKATEQPKALDKIRITVGSGLLKEVDFEYNYFNGVRLKLESIQQKNGSISMPPTRFEYQPGPIPAIGNHQQLFNQDHWGYYSGDNNTTLLTPFFGSGSGTFGPFTFSLNGNLRLPNEFFTKSGILTKITYPTGGTTNFEYESNDFFSSDPVEFLPPRGEFTNLAMATAETTLFIGERETRQTFTLNNRTYGKVDFTLQVANCGEGTATVRILKKLTQEQILQYHVYRSPNGIEPTQFMGPETNTVFVLEPGEYEVVANASIESSCSVPLTRIAKASITYKAWVPDTSGANYQAGGMRVGKITDCDIGQSTGCLTRKFTYSDIGDPEKSSGVLINAPLYSHDMELIYAIGDINSPTILRTNGKVLRANSFVPLANTQGSTIGYRYVTITTDEQATLGKTLHHYTSAAEYPDINFTEYPFPMNINNDWQRGSEIFNKIYTNTEQLKSETVTATTPKNYYNKRLAVQTAPRFKIVNGFNYTPQIGDYYFNAYEIKSGKTELTSQITTSFENGVSLSSSSNYYYENSAHLQPTKIETVNSLGELLTTVMKYPDDVLTLSGLTPIEVSGIQSSPNRHVVIEKLQSKNGIKQETVRTIVEGAKLKRALNSILNNPLEEVYAVNSYNAYGGVLNYTTRQGENVSYVYDELLLNPIAEVKNASVNNIFFTSFEDAGFDYNNDGRAGKRSKNGFTKSLNSLAPGSYTLSYWLKQAGQWNYFSNTVNVSGTTYTINISGQVDDVRFHPVNAIMTTFTYDVNGRISTVCDANNKVSSYEYDSMGRLINMRDDSKNIVKAFSYNFYQN